VEEPSTASIADIASVCFFALAKIVCVGAEQ